MRRSVTVPSDHDMGYLNPLFKLPAARGLMSLGEPERVALGRLMMDLRRQANDEAERAWHRRKGPMACYWRAVSTYARHVAHMLRKGRDERAVLAEDPEVVRLRRELAEVRRQVATLESAAALRDVGVEGGSAAGLDASVKPCPETRPC